MLAKISYEIGKKTAKVALNKTVHTTYKKRKKILTSSEANQTVNVAKRRGWGNPAENPKNIIRMDSELA